MSEHYTAIVRMDSVDAQGEFKAVLDMLVADGIITPNHLGDDLWRPSKWQAGPSADSVVDLTRPHREWSRVANGGVDVVASWDAYPAAENSTVSACPACAATLDEDQYWEYVTAWAELGEPLAACESCGASAPLGDWANEFPSVFGFPAVKFNNWPPLKHTFVDRVREKLGGRTTVVRAHL